MHYGYCGVASCGGCLTEIFCGNKVGREEEEELLL
jgi:hypothetical protein